jgi:parallel beta-helix repeat protein
MKPNRDDRVRLLRHAPRRQFRRLRRGAFPALFLILFLAPSTCLASTYYISSAGSDNDPGTLAQPWKTITHANNVVSAGDTVYLRAGSYGERGTKTIIDSGGTAAAPISWLAYPGDAEPTFLGQLEVTGSHNRISGLLFDGPSGPIGEEGENVLVWLNADDIKFDHNQVQNAAGHAGVFTSEADGFSIDKNYIHDNGVTFNLDHGIYVNSGSGRIENNLITDNYAWGIQLYPGGENVVVAHNTIVGNGRGGVIVSVDATDTSVVKNIVAENGEYGIRAYELVGDGNVANENVVWNQDFNTAGAEIGFIRNTVADPQFVGESEADFRLEEGSPAVGLGISPAVAAELAATESGPPPVEPPPPPPPPAEEEVVSPPPPPAEEEVVSPPPPPPPAEEEVVEPPAPPAEEVVPPAEEEAAVPPPPPFQEASPIPPPAEEKEKVVVPPPSSSPSPPSTETAEASPQRSWDWPRYRHFGRWLWRIWWSFTG